MTLEDFIFPMLLLIIGYLFWHRNFYRNKYYESKAEVEHLKKVVVVDIAKETFKLYLERNQPKDILDAEVIE